MVLGRALGDTYSPVVRQNLTLVTVARLVTNSAFRYVIPFLGVLADGWRTLYRAVLAPTGSVPN